MLPLPMASTVRFTDLYFEELRALPRARFALPGAALLAVLLLVFAVVMVPSPLGLWSFALLVYGTAPILVGASAALHMSSLRATRFADGLFTAPVRSRTVLAAHLLVQATVAALYLAATLPFLLVTALHIALPPGVIALFLGGALLMLYAVALGTLLGILLPSRSSAAPVALTVGFLVLAMLAIPLAASLQLGGATRPTLLMHLLHVSPYVLASDALGILQPSVGARAAAPGVAALLLVAQLALLPALAAWIFVREQGPLGWRAPPRRRGLFVAALVALLLIPGFAAGATYVPDAKPEAMLRGSSSYTQNLTAVLVAPGADFPRGSIDTSAAGTREAPLDSGRGNHRDLLLRLPVAAHVDVRGVRATFDAGPALQVEPASVSFAAPAPLAGEDQVVLRVPVVLAPLAAQDLTGNIHPLWINVTYQTAGQDTSHQGRALAALQADVPGAVLQLGLAGSVLALFATTAAVWRHRRIA